MSSTRSTSQLTIPSARFGRYSLRARVGEGGMAEIFRAEVVSGAGELQTVALKLLKRDAPPEIAALFDFEADVMGLLHHPNLVERLEIGEVAGRRYLAMEDVFGGDLGQLLLAHQRARTAVPLPLALRVTVELLHGLAHLHRVRSASGTELGLVHGDLSPGNILLSVDGAVKLCDFGVVTATLAGGSSLPPGTAVGTLHYLSPEHATGARLGPASDLFAVGVILHELVVGYRPFQGESEEELLAQIRAARVEVPAALVEPRLARILRRALAASPKDRHASAGELAGELVRFQLDGDLQCSARQLGDHLVELLDVAG